MECENEMIVISHRLFWDGNRNIPFHKWLPAISAIRNMSHMSSPEDRDEKSTRLDKPTSKKDPYEMYEIS